MMTKEILDWTTKVDGTQLLISKMLISNISSSNDLFFAIVLYKSHGNDPKAQNLGSNA